MNRPKTKENQYVLEPSEEELGAVLGIIKNCREGLKNFPEPLPFISQMYFGCTSDEIYMADEPFDFMDEKMPPLGVFTDIGAMSQGKYTEITPHGFAYVMFGGPKTDELTWALAMALVWERDRRRNGEVDGVHLPSIRDHLLKVIECLNANASELEFADDE